MIPPYHKNLRNLLKLCIFSLVLITLSFSVTSSDIFNPEIEGNQTSGNPVNLTFTNTSAGSYTVEIAPPFSNSRNKKLTYSNGSVKTTLNSSLIDNKGIYSYKVYKDSKQQFTNKSLSFSIASTNSTLRSKAENLTENVSQSADCDYRSNDFSCVYEHWQAEMILSNSVAYELTGNKTYLNRSLNYAISDYNDGFSYNACSHEENDFDCENDNSPDGITADSGVRQGSLIHALWTLYSYSDNQTVKQLALNYTQGSAKNCDVWGDKWEKSFECGNGRGQGNMIQAYWTAYKTTGNQTYQKIAQNFSKTNKSSSHVGNALFESYQVTGNETYLETARSISINSVNNITNDSIQTRLEKILMLWKGYRVTGEYGYYRNAVNLTSLNTNYTCQPWNGSFRCQYPQEQGLYRQALWKAYQYQKDQNRKIFNPQFTNVPQTGNNISLKFDMQGKIERPVVKYRERGDTSWRNCTVSFFSGCEIASGNVTNQTVYEYYIKSKELTFPENGSFRFGLSLENKIVKAQAENFSSSNPETYCKPWSDDFSCEDSFYQGRIIKGFSISYLQEKTVTYLRNLYNLASGPYRTLSGSNPVCDASENDFNCESKSVVEDLPGSVRQGSMIDSMFSAYRSTGNNTFYELAINYSQGSAEDCDVWSNDFYCGSGRGQGNMIQAYWTAYKTTGNQTYQKIAQNLSKNSLNRSFSRRLGIGMWRTYRNTNNTTYRDYAYNISSNFSKSCISGCKPENYAMNALLLEESYLSSTNESFLDNYRSMIQNTTTTGCGPYTSNYSCNTPEIQGLMTEAFRGASTILPKKFNVQTSLTLSPEEIELDQQATAHCSITSGMTETNLTDLKLEIDLDSNMSTSENTTLRYGNLSSNETANLSAEISANTTGTKQVRCISTSSNGLRRIAGKILNVTKIQKESESDEENNEEENNDGGGGSGGGSIGSWTPSGDEFEEKNFNYSMDNQSWDNQTLNQVIDTDEKIFYSQSNCLEAWRKVEKNKTVLSINYSCSKHVNMVLIDRNASGIYSSKVFENISKTDIEMVYQNASTDINWSQPLAVLYNRSPELQPEFDFKPAKDNETASIKVSMNRVTNCTITRNNTEVYSNETSKLGHKINLSEGRNQIEVKCGEETKSFSFDKHTEENVQDNDFQLVPIVILVTFSGIFAISFYFRNSIFEAKDSVILRFYMKQFHNKVKNGDTGEAIKIYDKMSESLGSSVSKDLLESDIDLVRGIRLYLMLDLVKSGIEEDLSMPANSLEDLVYNYVEKTDNDVMKDLINQKVNEIAKMKQK